MKKLIFLLSFFSSALQAQNLYLSSGISYNSMSTTVYNDRLHSYQKTISHKSSIDFINVMIEKKISGSLSLKTGIYNHVEFFQYERYYADMMGGRLSWEGGKYDFKVRNFDIPLLLSFNLETSGEVFNVSAGPYLGYCFYKYPPHDLPLEHSDFGINVSAGIGSSKWQVNAYLFAGQKNLVTNANEEAKGYTIGLNISRVLSIKKKVVSVKE
jgi:hypothetical protein